MWPILFVTPHHCSSLVWVGIHVFLFNILRLKRYWLHVTALLMKVKALHQGLVLCLFALTPLTNLLCFLICIFCLSLFWGGWGLVNTLAGSFPIITALFFCMGICSVYSILIDAHFFRNTTRIWNKVLVYILIFFTLSSVWGLLLLFCL
jgi:hypothetical protein